MFKKKKYCSQSEASRQRLQGLKGLLVDVCFKVLIYLFILFVQHLSKESHKVLYRISKYREKYSTLFA